MDMKPFGDIFCFSKICHQLFSRGGRPVELSGPLLKQNLIQIQKGCGCWRSFVWHVCVLALPWVRKSIDSILHAQQIEKYLPEIDESEFSAQ